MALSTTLRRSSTVSSLSTPFPYQARGAVETCNIWASVDVCRDGRIIERRTRSWHAGVKTVRSGLLGGPGPSPLSNESASVSEGG